jgi:hypothetical protein
VDLDLSAILGLLITFPCLQQMDAIYPCPKIQTLTDGFMRVWIEFTIHVECLNKIGSPDNIIGRGPQNF